jgi:hypothetical protein
MNKKLLTFILHDHAKIIIKLNHSADIVDAGYEARLFFIHYNHRFLLSYNFIASDIEILKKTLAQSLKNKFILDANFNENIGLHWNNTLNQKDISNGIFGEHFNTLNYYLLWSAGRCTWIYNDGQGNIIFEITTLYPDTYIYGKKKRSYRYFLKWMQTYKPIYKQIISKELALQWVDQANQILAIIDQNTQELHAQGKL